MAKVNLFGTIRVTKAFLPLIRRNQGRIVNLSSILGRSVEHYSAPYCITKFGIEAFSDALRLEMRPFNVKVCIVEPGNYLAATNITSGKNDMFKVSNQVWNRTDDTIKKEYGYPLFERLVTIFNLTTKFSVSHYKQFT